MPKEKEVNQCNQSTYMMGVFMNEGMTQIQCKLLSPDTKATKY